MSTRLPPLESLRFFEACARHANFTRAADELCVTPAAVSLRVRDLESELGTKLFDRSGPKVVLTAAGAALAGRVSEALGLVRAAVDACRSGAEPLRVTAVPTFATRWLAPRLPRYHALPDSVPIELDVSTELRDSESFDVAVRTGRGDWRGFESARLMPIEAAPMLSPALAAAARLSAPEDLATLPLLPHDDWPRWFRDAGGGEPALRFYADDYPTHELNALAAVEGVGAALLSPTFFDSLLREGKLVRPFAHVLQGPGWHYVLLRPNEARPGVLRFSRWLSEEARRSEAALG